MTAHRRFLLPLLGALSLGFVTDWARRESPALSESNAYLPAAEPAAPTAGADDGWFQTVSSQIQAAEYHASLGASGLQAPNRAQNLRAHFRNDGIEVVPRQEASEGVVWRFHWSTTRWGREDHLRTVKPVTARSEGARVVYPRHDFDEWYENKPEGIEQGFTIHSRPSGNGSLRLLGQMGGGLRPQPGDDGAVDFFDDGGARVLSYGKLKVWDAAGRVLPSRLQIEEEELAIVVDDDGAQYPLTIDPLMTSPSWTAESDQAYSGFGFSLGTAGDVNGDGYSDVIVGANTYDNGFEDEGAAFVYHGSAAGLSLTAAWTAESNYPGAYFGYSVASAGDVNSDGFSDVIVGAIRYSNGQTDEGRVFVFHGSAAGLGLTAAWTAECNQASSNFGTSVNAAGDVNNDGFGDVIVGASMYTNGQFNEGRAFVYHGSAAGLSLSAAWTAESNQASAFFGHSVNTAGDVNADGFSDVVVGAYGYDTSTFFNEGRAFVYHGSATGLAASTAWTAQSTQLNAAFGWSVGTAGDVNGDGFADVIVGARLDRNGETDEGRAYLYNGSATGLGAVAAWTAESNEPGASFGESVGTAGDINGDGYADVIVSAPKYTPQDFGRVFVYMGSETGPGLSAAWTVDGTQVNARFGGLARTAGDVNGDGYSEVIVGADGYDNGQADEGRAFLYRGSSSGLATTPGWTVVGGQAGEQFGWSLNTAGDVNGDGYSDVIIGADIYDNGQTNEGRAFVYHGAATGLGLTPAWTYESNSAGAGFGSTVGTARDVNGDGYSDVIVCAAANRRVFVFYGSFTGLSATPDWTAQSGQYGFYLTGGTAGDVNGDGYSDVIIGAWDYFAGQTDGGRAFAFYGSDSGLSPFPDWYAVSDQLFASFGGSVGTAGDVNGDGYSDVIVGAYGYGNGESDEGRAFVYYGSTSGLGLSPAWTAESNTPGGAFGFSVGTAGDVNGDGFSDVIVGGDGYNSGRGGAWFYPGSSTGLASTEAWFKQGTESSYLGTTVGTAGDVNGDGFSDVIVGGYLSPAFVFHGSSAGLVSLTPDWTVNYPLYAEDAATAGDVNGDGFSDVIVSNYDTDEGGQAVVYYGNGGDGLDLLPRQGRWDATALIDALGLSDQQIRFRLWATGRTPAGRGKVRLEWEVKPFGVPFDGTGAYVNSPTDTGTPGIYGYAGSAAGLSQLNGSLNQGELYHWRLRILTDSPDFPRSRWLSPPFNAASEADVRMPFSQSAVDESAPPATRFRLEAATPNPFASSTRLAYTLRERGPVRLAVYDVAGREVTVLADEMQEAGDYATTWDGHGTRGEKLSAGIYFARLRFGTQVESRKIVLTR